DCPCVSVHVCVCGISHSNMCIRGCVTEAMFTTTPCKRDYDHVCRLLNTGRRYVCLCIHPPVHLLSVYVRTCVCACVRGSVIERKRNGKKYRVCVCVCICVYVCVCVCVCVGGCAHACIC